MNGIHFSESTSPASARSVPAPERGVIASPMRMADAITVITGVRYMNMLVLIAPRF